MKDVIIKHTGFGKFSVDVTDESGNKTPFDIKSGDKVDIKYTSYAELGTDREVVNEDDLTIYFSGSHPFYKPSVKMQYVINAPYTQSEE